jgi:hypothetical protein
MSKEELKTTLERVRRILETNVLARNFDHVLVYLVLKEALGTVESIVKLEPIGLSKLPAFETITRCRRHWQNTMKMYPADPTINKKRKAREQEFRKFFGKNDDGFNEELFQGA